MSTVCPAEVRFGDHLYVVVVSRPWRRGFRRTFWLRCWECEVRVMDPVSHLGLTC